MLIYIMTEWGKANIKISGAVWLVQRKTSCYCSAPY